MPGPSYMRKWSGLPSRIALLLGIGAMTATAAPQSEARSVVPSEPPQVPQHSAANFGEVQLWSEGGRIYLSEASGEPRQLRLGDTAEARALRELLERHGATAATPHIMRHRIILVGGGGMGIPPDPTSAPQRPASRTGHDATAPSRSRRGEDASAAVTPARRGEQER
jgi:hypothetical protein